MTCCALAEHDQVLADRLQSELCIESRYAVDFGRFDPCRIRNVVDRVDGQITVDFLSFLQNSDETTRHLCILV